MSEHRRQFNIRLNPAERATADALALALNCSRVGVLRAALALAADARLTELRARVDELPEAAERRAAATRAAAVQAQREAAQERRIAAQAAREAREAAWAERAHVKAQREREWREADDARRAARQAETERYRARDQRAVELRAQGCSWAQVGAEIGLAADAAWKAAKRHRARCPAGPVA